MIVVYYLMNIHYALKAKPDIKPYKTCHKPDDPLNPNL